MEFLACAHTLRTNLFLRELRLEDHIKGCIKAYSYENTKMESADFLCLMAQVFAYFRTAYESALTPFGELLDSFYSEAKCLVLLVMAFKEMYPLCSTEMAHQYFQEVTLDAFKQDFLTEMTLATREWNTMNGQPTLLDQLLVDLEEVVRLNDCKLYYYVPEGDEVSDPMHEAARMSSHTFFYNPIMKRVVILKICQMSKYYNFSDGYPTDHSDEDEDDMES